MLTLIAITATIWNLIVPWNVHWYEYYGQFAFAVAFVAALRARLRGAGAFHAALSVFLICYTLDITLCGLMSIGAIPPQPLFSCRISMPQTVRPPAFIVPLIIVVGVVMTTLPALLAIVVARVIKRFTGGNPRAVA